LLDSDRGAAGIRSVVGLANHLVIERGQSLGTSIGTTLTLAVVEPGVARIGHVGDSRAYLIHRGAITQITEDHSLVAELVREGTISEEDAREHEQRNVLRRAVGVSEDLEVDIFEAGIAPGDTLALCTDGLSTMVRPEEILAVVDSSPSMEEAASKLVSLAYQRGGDDNITAILWRYPGGLDQVRQTLVSSPPTAARSSLRAEIRILRTAFATAAGLMGLALGLVLGWLIRKGFP
jgi:serine/threonine protein phosphatase PrpC